MSDEIEMPNEALERHEHAGEHAAHESHGGRITLLILVLAMCAAVAGKISAENEIKYLTNEIELSDTWAQYQGKSDRQAIARGLATIASVLPNAADPAVQKVISDFRSSADRMEKDDQGEGKAQLADKAKHLQAARDDAARKMEGFSITVVLLAIAIGLGSASMLSRQQLPPPGTERHQRGGGRGGGGVRAVGGVGSGLKVHSNYMQPVLFIPNPEQVRVISAPPSARLVVDAGPGTGKTATAAARILRLIADGADPHRIWMIGFARAAVLEMRQRLAAEGADAANLPRVTTLDSMAWRLRAADMDAETSVMEGHDVAIAETLQRVRARDPEILRRLSGIRHFLVDEAQDLVGNRAMLVAEIVALLDASAGVTILTDEAQAIYGFAGGHSMHALEGDTVARHLAASAAFTVHHLHRIHRTDRAVLLTLFATARREVMRDHHDPYRKLQRVHRTISRLARRRWWQAKPLADGPDTLVLYRSRAEVLAEFTRRSFAGQPCRLRLSGLPVALHPWLAIILHDWTGSSLSESGFAALWRKRMGDDDPEPAWVLLRDLAGEGRRVDMPRLMHLLRAAHPPAELTVLDPGHGEGPVIGTIHASKGREMAHVRLMLPGEHTGRDDPEDEARVLFVGATRAKTSLTLGRGMKLRVSHLGGGRVALPDGANKGRIEIGRPHDFTYRDIDPALLRALPMVCRAEAGVPGCQAGLVV